MKDIIALVLFVAIGTFIFSLPALIILFISEAAAREK